MKEQRDNGWPLNPDLQGFLSGRTHVDRCHTGVILYTSVLRASPGHTHMITIISLISKENDTASVNVDSVGVIVIVTDCHQRSFKW